MTLQDALEFSFFIFLLLILAPPLGAYMAYVYDHEKITMTPLLWLENFCYRVAGVDPTSGMDVSTYIKSLLLFNFLGFLTVFLLMLTQGILPLNPENFSGTSLHLAFNTAISFMTNTNWQSYSPETTLSYLTQMVGLTVQNFLSAATGFAVMVALVRGIKTKEGNNIGNFWQDLVRSVVYILLPLSIILACALLTQGVIQSFSPYEKITTLEGASQTIPMGPVASQVAIKQLGSNGGGFFNANSTHPFENPTPLSNFLQTLSILLIPSASIYFYGTTVGNIKHARLLYGVVLLLFLIGFTVALYGEHLYSVNIQANPAFEGKETRFGVENSILWTSATSATSSGSINAVISSLSPIAGGVALFNIMLGETVFGGVGVGLCSLILFVLLTVFLSGLMVGRTPEYMGKKIEVREMLWITVAILTPAALILIGSGISSVLPIATTTLKDEGPHGLTAILYAFSSTAGNNGSAFSELDANTPYYNLFLGVIMLIGRLAILIPSLQIAALLVKKKITPPSLGTFSTSSPLFALLLFSVILLAGSLTFFPALALGPIIEHLLMMENKFF